MLTLAAGLLGVFVYVLMWELFLTVTVREVERES